MCEIWPVGFLDNESTSWYCDRSLRRPTFLDGMPWQRVLGNLIEERILGGVFWWSWLGEIHLAVAKEGIAIDILRRHCAARCVERSDSKRCLQSTARLVDLFVIDATARSVSAIGQ